MPTNKPPPRTAANLGHRRTLPFHLRTLLGGHRLIDLTTRPPGRPESCSCAATLERKPQVARCGSRPSPPRSNGRAPAEEPAPEQPLRPAALRQATRPVACRQPRDPQPGLSQSGSQADCLAVTEPARASAFLSGCANELPTLAPPTWCPTCSRRGSSDRGSSREAAGRTSEGHRHRGTR